MGRYWWIIVVGIVVNGWLGAEEASPLEMRQYHLSDYHLPVSPYPAPPSPLGLIPAAPGATFAEPPSLTSCASYDVDVIIEFIERTVSPGSWDKDGAKIVKIDDSVLVVTATPAIQVRTAQALSALGALVQRCGVQVDFGSIPSGEHCPTGIIPTADAQSLRERLHDRVTLSATGIADKIMFAESVRDQHYTSSAKVADGRLRPITSDLRRGKAFAAIMALDGRHATVSAWLSWVDDAAPPGASLVRCPAHILPQTTITSPAATMKVDGHEVAGEQFMLDLPELWTWRPVETCILADDQALALVCDHGGDRAVMILAVEFPAQHPALPGIADGTLTSRLYAVSHLLRDHSSSPGWSKAPGEGNDELGEFRFVEGGTPS